jgi:DtxR family Mn-dependent transcriptional regulator
MQITVIESDSTRIRFSADTEECVLAPVFASNITVIPIEEKQEIKEEFNVLADLRPGQSASVVSISKACRGQQRRRLMDFGIVPGTKIYSALESLGGDPRAYIVRGTKVALRTKQAGQIFISDLVRK